MMKDLDNPLVLQKALDELSEKEKAYAQTFTTLVHTNGYDKTMGFLVKRVGEGEGEMLFPTNVSAHGNASGQIHGGAFVAFSDTAMGLACFSLGKRVNTIEINGNYLRYVKAGETITAKSRVVHNGHTTMVAEVGIYNEENRLVYTGRGTFFVRGFFDLPEEI